MDLNQLYFEHQRARMRAKSAISARFRHACLSDAAQLARQIGELQLSLGAAAAAAWTAKGSRNALRKEAASKGAQLI